MKSMVRGLAAMVEDEDGERRHEPFEIEIPDRVEDYAQIFADLDKLLADGDETTYREWMRALFAADLYFVGLMSSWGSRLDPYRSAEAGRDLTEISAPFLFKFAREVQFDHEDVLDTGARGHWKTTFKLLLFIQFMIQDVNVSMGVFAYDKAAAEKHTARLATELVTNAVWTQTFPDAFGEIETGTQVARLKGSPMWDARKGYVIPGRTISSQSPTFAPYGYLHSVSAGGRLGKILLDDFENESIVRNPETVEKAWDSILSVTRLQGRGTARLANGTFHSANGPLARLAKLDTWRVRCYEIVDTTKPAPKIPAIDPLTGKAVPDAIRAQDIEGEPRLFHPLEVAKIRTEHVQSGKLDDYYRHYFGDVTRGQIRRLSSGLLQWYEGDPRQVAMERNLHVVLCLDPGGSIDPHYFWVWGVSWDRNYYWLDAEMRVCEPSQRKETALTLALKWMQFARVAQVRVEIFGASTIDIELAEHYGENGIHGGASFVQAIRDTTGASAAFADLADGGKMSRAYDRWQSPLAEGRVYFPRRMPRRVSEGTTSDLVERFVENELNPFPHCKEDHGLDSGGLIFHVGGKVKPIPLPARPAPRLPEYHGLPKPSYRSA